MAAPVRRSAAGAAERTLTRVPALVIRVGTRSSRARGSRQRLAALKQRRSGHDLGDVVRDLAVMLADGGDCLADLGALGDQRPLFGAVASASTAFRLIDRIARDPDGLGRLRAAHARARERAWKLAGAPQRLTIDLDATLVTAHSDKEGAGRQPQGRVRLSGAPVELWVKGSSGERDDDAGADERDKGGRGVEADEPSRVSRRPGFVVSNLQGIEISLALSGA